MTIESTHLTPEEWNLIEQLAQCHEAIEDCPGIDYGRFHDGIVNLQDQVLALPAKRALKMENPHES